MNTRLTPQGHTVKILLVGANPNDQTTLRISREIGEIEKKLRGAGHADALQFVVRPAAEADDLRRALHEVEPDIVHFSGHGTKDDILFEEHDGGSRRVSKEALAGLFGSMRGRTRVVVLNCCYSSSHAEAIQAHVDCTIGMSRPLEDREAIAFSAAFYEAIGFGNPVDTAFKLGRNALQLLNSKNVDVPKLLVKDGVEPGSLLLTKPPGPPEAASSELSRGSSAASAEPPRPSALFLLDLASDNPISLEDVQPHLPNGRVDRIYRATEFGARPTPRGSTLDFRVCADAVARMVRKARDEAPTQGPPGRFYVAGRAALPVFAHLGLELSAWANVTLVNQRKEGPWDVLPLRVDQASGCPSFFRTIQGLDGKPSVTEGRVAILLSTGHPFDEEDIHSFFRKHNAPVAGIVELRAGDGGVGLLDAERSPAAMSDLCALFANLKASYPRLTGVALFIAGPATLAFMAGRAINPHVIPSIWVPTFEAHAYHFTVELPWRERRRLDVSQTAEHQLERLRILSSIRAQIELLQGTLRPAHLPPSLTEQEKTRLLERLCAIDVAREPQGEAFDLRASEGTMSFGAGLLDTLRSTPEEQRTPVGLSVFLHELFHFDQNLHTPLHANAGRASIALEEIDYWADAMSVSTLVAWEVSESGEAGKRRMPAIVSSYVDAALRGIEAFDRYEQSNDRIDKLAERRLRRYLIWHLQRTRAETVRRTEDLWELFGKRLFVELAPLRGHLDERYDKIVDGPLDDTELFVVLQGQLLRTPRQGSFDPRALVDAVRTFNSSAMTEAMRMVREQHRRALLPWVR